jgi:hypothetical protein
MLAMRPEIRALGWMADGSPIYPIWGCDPDPTGDPAGGTGEGGTGEGGGVDPSGETGDPVDPAGGPDPTALAQQIEVLTKRLLAADRAKGEAEKRLRDIDDQGKSELEKLRADNQELAARAEAATQAATRARLEREILKHPGYIWHDPEVVLALVDMSNIEIDEETDKVTGVNDALKKLAASKPFLLKGKNPDGGGTGGGNGATGGRPAGSSGTNPSGGAPNNAEKRRDELAKKYKL